MKEFEALLRCIEDLSGEERRAVREGLDRESVAIYDLLRKPDLSAADVDRVKSVAAELLATLKADKLRIDQWRGNESTRDPVHVTIQDFLWSDDTGLPVDAYDEREVEEYSEEVFRRVFRAYPTLPSPFYAEAL